MVKLSVKKSSEFWIYNFPYHVWKEIGKNDSVSLIGSTEYYDIKKNDIVLFTKKDKGFCGFVKILKDLKINHKNISVCKDINLSKYYFKGEIYKTYRTVKVSDIFDECIRCDKKYHDRSASFSKYIIPNFFDIKKIDREVGKRILKGLAENIGEKDDSENTTTTSENCESDKKETESESFCESESFDLDKDEEDFIVPVSVVPCSKNRPHTDLKKRFSHLIDHVKCCKICNITDNNDINVINVISNDRENDGEFVVVKNDYDIEHIIEDYSQCRKSDIDDITAYYVDIDDNLYDRCYFIVGKI